MENFMYSTELENKAKEFSNSCINCGCCIKECEMLKNFNIKPKDFFDTEKQALKTDPIIPYSCSMCGKCVKVCPRALKLENLFFDMRKEQVKNNNGSSPIKGHKKIDMHQKFSFSNLFSAAIPDAKAGFTKRVFIPGCSLASYNPVLIEKTLVFLQERLPGTGVILKCCGKPTLALGKEEKFHKRYSTLQLEIDRLGVEEIITSCQNCFTTISKFSPKQKVRSLWTIIPELGLPNGMKEKGKRSDIVFTIHDACPTRDCADIQDSIRWIINELGYKVKETSCSRENTRCCGFGGMVAPANPELAQKIMKKNASELEEDYVITYCASCREAMTIGGKKAVHILDLMLNDTYDTNSKVPGLNKSFVDNWIIRHKSKKIVKTFERL